MNVKVTYDKETTEVFEELKSLREVYMKRLVAHIKEKDLLSHKETLIKRDPGLKELDKQIKKLYKLSIPVCVEIINEHTYGQFRGLD